MMPAPVLVQAAQCSRVLPTKTEAKVVEAVEKSQPVWWKYPDLVLSTPCAELLFERVHAEAKRIGGDICRNGRARLSED